jgi:hypothetical protein
VPAVESPSKISRLSLPRRMNAWSALAVLWNSTVAWLPSWKFASPARARSWKTMAAAPRL